MNKFVTGALALAAASSAAYAGPGDSEWLELDSEISGLASSMTTQGNVSGFAGLFRGTLGYSTDDLAQNGTQDLSGWTLEDIDLAAFGEVGDYGYRISMDLDSGSANLEDAFVFWGCGDYFTATMGQYKSRVFRSNDVDPEKQLFINRTILGAAFDGWDPGVGASGDYDDFRWNIDLQNGNSGQYSDHRYSLRGEYLYNGGAGDYEGAYGAGDDAAGTIGVSYVSDDTTSGDSTMFGLDVNGTAGPIGWGAELAEFDDDFNGSTGSNYLGTMSGLSLDGDSSPMTLTLSYMINDEFEAGFRFQDTDNADDESAISLGLNWYQSGHNAKWQAEINDVSTDAAGVDDSTIFRVGLAVGATR